MVPSGQSVCQYCPNSLSVCPSGKPVCRYCPNRLVGVCLEASRCVDIVRIDMSVCVFGTKWPASVSILSEKACRCVPMIPSGQSVCQYCPNRLVGVCPSGQPVCRYCTNRLAGVCHWYQVASRCVDIVRRDLPMCVIGTKWPAGVSILYE